MDRPRQVIESEREPGAARASNATREPSVVRAVLEVRRRGDRSVISMLRGEPPLRLLPLADDAAVARVALVQSAAMLLAGDRVALSVRVGEDAALELIEIGATIAHPVAAGLPPIEQWMEVTVGPRATAAILGQPLILAAGTRARREVRIELHDDARCLQLDMTVLGRHGEPPGTGCVRTRMQRDGAPVLDDTLDTAALDALRSAAVIGEAKVLGALVLGGWACEADGWACESPDGTLHEFDLGGEDRLIRAVGTGAARRLQAVAVAAAAEHRRAPAGVSLNPARRQQPLPA